MASFLIRALTLSFGPLFLLAGPKTCSAQTSSTLTGTISGIVLDQSHEAVSNARVIFYPTPRVSGIVISATTNGQGQFTKSGLPFGQYIVRAEYPEAGYSILNTQFIHDPTPLLVELSEPSPYSRLSLTLGPRGGFLLGTIRDAESGAPIQGASVCVRSNAHPKLGYCVSAPEVFKLCVPPSYAIRAEVIAPGYATWQSSDESAPSGALVLSPDESLPLYIELHKRPVQP